MYSQWGWKQEEEGRGLFTWAAGLEHGVSLVVGSVYGHHLSDPGDPRQGRAGSRAHEHGAVPYLHHLGAGRQRDLGEPAGQLLHCNNKHSSC